MVVIVKKSTGLLSVLFLMAFSVRNTINIDIKQNLP